MFGHRSEKTQWSVKQGRGSEMVTASEIAAFVYCPEAWRLEHRLGLEAGNRAASGRTDHAGKAAAELGRGRVQRHRAAGGRTGGLGAARAVGDLPMMATPWVAVGAVLALVVGLLLVAVGWPTAI